MTDGNLETERLYLRRITLDDADLMLAIWNDPSFVRNVGDRGIHTIEQARDAGLLRGSLTSRQLGEQIDHNRICTHGALSQPPGLEKPGGPQPFIQPHL